MPLPKAPPEPPINRDLASLDPEVAELCRRHIIACAHYGVGLRIVECRRSLERQAWLYGIGREYAHPSGHERKVTNAMPGQSNHEDGRAYDCVPMAAWGVSADWDSPLWEQIGREAEKLGLEWGGRWSGIHDKPHFQLRRS